MVHAVFSDIGTYDIDHPIVNLISSMSADISGTINHPYTECPSVVVKKIRVSSGLITYFICISADIIKEFSTPVNIAVSGNAKDIVQYNKDGIHICICPSGLTIQDGDYVIEFTLRLNNITIHPERSITVTSDQKPGRLTVHSGYNVDVSIVNNTMTILGSPGAGKGKYIKGGLDKLYQGVRSINGINTGNNINIEVSDALISDGGSV